MTGQAQHILVTIPGTSLGAAVERSLTQGRALVARAGYGSGDERRVLVVDGICAQPAAGLNGFFVHAGARAREFAARLRGPVGRLVLPIMPYDAYFPLLWRTQAQRRVVEDFAGLAPALAAGLRGWPDLVADLSEALQPREVVLLPAPATAAQALAALMPNVSISPRSAQGRDMPDTALAMVQRMFRVGVRPDPQQLMRLVAFHARQPQPAPLAAFNPLEAAVLRRRFRCDLDQLAALPGLRIGAMPQLIAAE